MSYRIDKFIWSVRLAKTRTLASDLVNKGKFRLNGENVKPSKTVKLGDEIQFNKNTAVFTFRIIQLLDKRVGAKLVKDYLIDITPEDELIKDEQYRLNQRSYKTFGTGKPSKKQRRDLDDFIDNWD